MDYLAPRYHVLAPTSTARARPPWRAKRPAQRCANELAPPRAGAEARARAADAGRGIPTAPRWRWHAAGRIRAPRDRVQRARLSRLVRCCFACRAAGLELPKSTSTGCKAALDRTPSQRRGADGACTQVWSILSRGDYSGHRGAVGMPTASAARARARAPARGARARRAA